MKKIRSRQERGLSKYDAPLIIQYNVANLGAIKLCLAPQCNQDN